MPELDGLEVLKQVRADADPPEVIIITGNGTIETAISAMKLGAYDYLAKPYRMAEIDVLVRRAWEKRRLARENVLLQSQLERAGGATEIVTQYAPLQAVLDARRARRAERFAGAHHAASRARARSSSRTCCTGSRGRAGPFVDVSCAALAEGMLESELFGHERGAFAGADERKLGLMELAAGGTLFLDEIGELSIRSCRASCCARSSSAASIRVGGTQKVEVDVRIVAATNRDLARARRARARFRDDLFYRVNTIAIELPPLRERAVDIPLLARHFLAAVRQGATRRRSPPTRSSCSRGIRGRATCASCRT